VVVLVNTQALLVRDLEGQAVVVVDLQVEQELLEVLI
jgi:hypothetical protein